MTVILMFAFTGLVAGLLAGLLGIGGGLVVVPMLYFHFSANPVTAPHAMHLALGSSLAFIVINSGIAAWTHARLDGVRWREFRLLAPGLAAGGLAGAALADNLSTVALARFFGSFLLAMSAWMLFRPAGTRRDVPESLSYVIGLPMGTLAALAGVGGGVMVVPWLLARGHSAAHAVSTSSVCTVVVAAIGAAGYIFLAESLQLDGVTGYVHWYAVLGVAVTALLTAQIGARLAHRIDQRLLRRIFALLLAVVGARLLYAA